MLEAIDQLIAISVVASQIIAIVFLIAFAIRHKNRDSSIVVLLEKYGLLIAFLTVLGSTLGSLYYSEIHDFAPCVLCWWQRVVMYPQVVLLGIALWRSDYNIRIYSIILSSIGLAISIYQLLLPYLNVSLIPCSASAVSCTIIYVQYFGYITIPVMAFSSWILTILSVSFWKIRNDATSR